MQTKPNWNCGLTRVMDALSSKWALQIFWVISQKGPIRFNQLKRGVDGITKITLTRSLDSLIRTSLFSKKTSRLGHSILSIH